MNACPWMNECMSHTFRVGTIPMPSKIVSFSGSVKSSVQSHQMFLIVIRHHPMAAGSGGERHHVRKENDAQRDRREGGVLRILFPKHGAVTIREQKCVRRHVQSDYMGMDWD